MSTVAFPRLMACLGRIGAGGMTTGRAGLNALILEIVGLGKKFLF